MLTEYGAALIDGVDSPEALLRLAHSIGVVAPHRDSGPDGITTLANLGMSKAGTSGFAGFTSRSLDPHTDRAGLAHPPELLLMACGHAAMAGGECLLVDGHAVYDILVVEAPEAVRALSRPGCALFGVDETHLGSVFGPSACGSRVTVRLRSDDLVCFAPEAAHWLPTLRAAIERCTIDVALRRGEGYVLHNYRWLHGRRAFTGNRMMFRCMQTRYHT